MKLSISWIFDHIQADWRSLDIPELVHQFNLTTAEIEGFRKVSIDLEQLFLVQVRSVPSRTIIDPEENNVEVYCSEIKKEVLLPSRDDVFVGQPTENNLKLGCLWPSCFITYL